MHHQNVLTLIGPPSLNYKLSTIETKRQTTLDVGVFLKCHWRIRSDIGTMPTVLQDQLVPLELIKFHLKALARPFAGTRAFWHWLKSSIRQAGKDPNSKYLYSEVIITKITVKFNEVASLL